VRGEQAVRGRKTPRAFHCCLCEGRTRA
jgi:hypothetical protein